MKYPISETFYKGGKLFYVESQHADKCDSFRCLPVDDEDDDCLYLTKHDIQQYIDCHEHQERQADIEACDAGLFN